MRHLFIDVETGELVGDSAIFVPVGSPARWDLVSAATLLDVHRGGSGDTLWAQRETLPDPIVPGLAVYEAAATTPASVIEVVEGQAQLVLPDLDEVRRAELQFVAFLEQF